MLYILQSICCHALTVMHCCSLSQSRTVLVGQEGLGSKEQYDIYIKMKHHY